MEPITVNIEAILRLIFTNPFVSSVSPNGKVLPSATRAIGFLAKLLQCPFPDLEPTNQLFILRNTLKTRVRAQKEQGKKRI